MDKPGSEPGSIPWLEIEPDDTDPEPFGPGVSQVPETEIDTVPRCVTCGRASDSATCFEQGVRYALRGLYWTLCKRYSKRDAAQLAIWLQTEIKG